MFAITPNQAIQIGLIVTPLLFLLSAYLTRATPRRILAALAGGAVYGGLNGLWDQVAIPAGWWWYGYGLDGRFPPLMYVLSGLVAGGAIGLLGWRVVRNYGGRGLVAFLTVWTFWGTLHDLAGSAVFASSSLMVFGPGLLPALADVVLYLTCGLAAQVAIRVVGGPAGADSLARHRLSLHSR